MTIMEAIARVDERRHNTCSREEKIRWLSQLDQKIYEKILMNHRGTPEGEPPCYDGKTPGSRELLVKEPFSDLYLYWLEAQICYCQGEIGDHNGAAALFNRELTEFEKHHKNRNLPLCRGSRFRF